MSYFPWAVFQLFLYAVPTAIVCLPIVLWFRSYEWRWWELALPIAPFILWLCLVAISDKGKTLTNAVVEPLLCGCVACVPIMLRAAATRWEWRVGLAYCIGLLISCAVTTIIYLEMPPLPE